MSEERVVLLDEAGRAIGSAPKQEVHHRNTPLHLAFSCYVFNADGSVLITRRALDKPTFPGVWTNSVCGHPAPGEDMVAAVHRRARDELGVRVRDVRLALPAYRYLATMPNGVRENEMCPVFIGTTADDVDLNPAEVHAAVWEPWEAFSEDVAAGRREVSLWCAEQVAQLRPLPLGSPRAIRTSTAVDHSADPALLPPAAIHPREFGPSQY